MIQHSNTKERMEVINDCVYPNCQLCASEECDKEQKDIVSLLKHRRWAANPTLYRQKQQDYREKIKSNLPHCDECKSCVLVENQKGDGYRRLCIDKMRLIEQKVSNSPQWCRKRRDKRNEEIFGKITRRKNGIEK